MCYLLKQKVGRYFIHLWLEFDLSTEVQSVSSIGNIKLTRN